MSDPLQAGFDLGPELGLEAAARSIATLPALRPSAPAIAATAGDSEAWPRRPVDEREPHERRTFAEQATAHNLRLRPVRVTEYGPTAEIVEKILLLVSDGARPEDAVMACGIAPSVYLRWLQRAEQDLLLLEALPPEQRASTDQTSEVVLLLAVVQAAGQAKMQVGRKLYAKAKQGDTKAAELWLRLQKVAGFGPPSALTPQHERVIDMPDIEIVVEEGGI